MRKFATGDCETDPFKVGRVPAPFIWGFYDETSNEPFKYFFNTKDFIDFIKEYEGIIYMHNGGKFDFFFLFEGLDPQEDIMIINGRIAKLKIGKCELRDSFLLLPVPLSAYQKDEIDYSKFEKEVRSKYMHEIVPYLKGDCKYLYDILKANFEDYGQKLTLATSAFDFWHKKFNHDEYKPKSNMGFFKFYKDYYYGGRVQCFEKGIIDKPFLVVDIRSAYPYAMTFDHPYGNQYTTHKELPENFERCFIHLNCNSIGILPFREKGKLTFPSDNQFRNFFSTGWELKLALENGLKINKIFRITEFKRSINFKEYVKYFFTLKESFRGIDPARYLLSKLYLNSLYGKFGQSSLDHKNYDLIKPQYIEDYISNDGYTFESEMGDYALMSCPINEKHMRFYNVCTASSITGFVRAYLYRAILSCDKPLYCDTDSIAYMGNGSFNIGEEIGEWSLEGDFDKGAICGKKLYAFKYADKEKYKISSKGVKLTEKEIFSIAQGNTILYKNDAPTFSINKEVTFLERNVTMT